MAPGVAVGRAGAGERVIPGASSRSRLTGFGVLERLALLGLVAQARPMGCRLLHTLRMGSGPEGSACPAIDAGQLLRVPRRWCPAAITTPVAAAPFAAITGLHACCVQGFSLLV